MAKKITRIKASDSPRKDEAEQPILRKKIVATDKKQEKAKIEQQKAAKKAGKSAAKAEKEKTDKKVFILFRPFVALGRYLRDSWREIRQVRWPNRKATWKMVVAVLVYTAIFVLFISLLDLFFRWLFSLIIK